MKLKKFSLTSGTNHISLSRGFHLNYDESIDKIEIISDNPQDEQDEIELIFYKNGMTGVGREYIYKNQIDEKIPESYFKLYRDGKSELYIESNHNCCLIIYYRKRENIFEKNIYQNELEKMKQKSKEKYYQKYYQVVTDDDGSVYFEPLNLDNFQYHPDDEILMKLLNKNHTPKTLENVSKCILLGGIDYYNEIIIESSDNQKMQIFIGGRLEKELEIKQGKHNYPLKLLRRYLSFQDVDLIFEKKVQTIDFHILQFPKSICDVCKNHNLRDRVNGYKIYNSFFVSIPQ